jgi:hypothetical protein
MLKKLEIDKRIHGETKKLGMYYVLCRKSYWMDGWIDFDSSTNGNGGERGGEKRDGGGRKGGLAFGALGFHCLLCT